MVNSVLVEMNWLNVMLVVVFVVHHMMRIETFVNNFLHILVVRVQMKRLVFICFLLRRLRDLSASLFLNGLRLFDVGLRLFDVGLRLFDDSLRLFNDSLRLY